MSNVIFCWGCKPAYGVLADTRMIHDFNDTLQARYDKKTLCLAFPEILDNMLGAKDDCDWEFWKSNQIQTCRIQYKHNLTTKINDRGTPETRGRGIIIINSKLINPCEKYLKEGEKALEKTKELYIETKMMEWDDKRLA